MSRMSPYVRRQDASILGFQTIDVAGFAPIFRQDGSSSLLKFQQIIGAASRYTTQDVMPLSHAPESLHGKLGRVQIDFETNDSRRYMRGCARSSTGSASFGLSRRSSYP
ncbi:hypothetical protein LIA77_11323 [Sarocladium implicatum]|nr:hypothetical protein LIA77_11323 [Sarocladium implicatum]